MNVCISDHSSEARTLNDSRPSNENKGIPHSVSAECGVQQVTRGVRTMNDYSPAHITLAIEVTAPYTRLNESRMNW